MVVQLVRMPPCHGGGRGFESRPFRSQCSKALVNQGLLSFMERSARTFDLKYLTFHFVHSYYLIILQTKMYNFSPPK
jgi:hypothetical protein